MRRSASTWPGCGRVGLVSFGRGPCMHHTSRSDAGSGDGSGSSSPRSSSGGAGVAPVILEDDARGGAWVAGGLCAGALARARGAQGGASFGAGQGDELRAAHALLTRAQATPASPRHLAGGHPRQRALLASPFVGTMGVLGAYVCVYLCA